MERRRHIYRVTLAGAGINLLLLALKFLAGVMGHSSAMLADACHSLSDFASDFVVLIFVRVAGRPSDSSHDYGHGKFETLAALAIGVMLLGLGAGILADGLTSVAKALRGQKLPEPNALALGAALFSLIAKEWLYHYTIKAAKDAASPALAANAWHHRSDALTSLAALAGIGGAMLLGPRWTILDPAAAIVVSVFIVRASLALIAPGIGELMEKSLPGEEKERIAQIISQTQGVLAFHSLRTRRIGPGRAVEAHIQLARDMSLLKAHAIASQIEARIREEFGENTHVAIHMEPAKKSQ